MYAIRSYYAGDVLKQLKPFLYLVEKMGKMQAQITKGGVREVNIEYIGSGKEGREGLIS